jgi:hypothetical protein
MQMSATNIRFGRESRLWFVGCVTVAPGERWTNGTEHVVEPDSRNRT